MLFSNILPLGRVTICIHVSLFGQDKFIMIHISIKSRKVQPYESILDTGPPTDHTMVLHMKITIYLSQMTVVLSGHALYLSL